LDVFVLGVDNLNRKIALGLKELQPDPWVTAKEKFKVGQIVKGKVMRLVKFGAFVKIDEGLEGLVHISEMSDKNVERPEDAVKIGDEVEVKILRILAEEQKIGLSIKEANLEKQKKEFEQQQAEVKVTIGDVIAEKEKQKAEKESEEEIEEEVEEGSGEETGEQQQQL
jgi:small subunit ribosomal protein S1